MSVRVLHVVSAGEIGGAERVVVDLAAPRPGGGAAHAVALWAPTPALGEYLRGHGVTVHDAGPAPEHARAFLTRSLSAGAVAWLEALVRRERFTVVHVHTFASQVLGTRAARRAGAALLRTEHSTRAFLDRVCWPFARWSLRRADASVAVSRYVRDVALHRAPWAAPWMHVIANGVAPRARGSAPVEPAGARPFRFVALGRLEPRKGLDLALDALGDTPGATLDVVGDGELRAGLEARVARAGLAARVTFHGYVADPTPLLLRADAALSSARDEGLGLALLEAMAAGRPVVAVPVGGLTEIVRPGETGWLARERSRAALAEVMREAASDPARARRLGEAARAQVTERYSLAAMRAAYDALYEALTARTRRP